MGEVVSFPLEFLLHVLLTCVVVACELLASWWRKLWTPRRQ